ncbi:MAG: type IV pili methyl-accepting chemotaxis transducer N-terminal domain-containing protein, partial [Thermodesulfobacteriota bacterium]
MSIRVKLGLLMVSFIGLLLATIIATFWTVGQLKSDGKVINMAGRQRMLTQKMTKEVAALLQGKAESASVLATADLFDKSLNALISGDRSQGIPPAENPAIRTQLTKVQTMWGEFKDNLEGLVAVSDRRQGVYAYLMERNVLLLTKMNKAVGMMQKQGLPAKTINIAGRQRMLTQKMTKEALALDMGAATIEEFFATVALFDKTLGGLVNGDAELGLRPVQDPAILSQLGKVREEWKPFKANAEKLAEAAVGVERYTGYILANNVPLLKEANVAVGQYEADSAGKISSLKKMQMGFFLLTLALFGVGWVFLSRIIIQPVKRMSELASTVARGDLDVNVNVNSNDELGVMGRAFSDMVAYLKAMAHTAEAIAGGDLTHTVEPQGEKDVLGNAFKEMVGGLRSMVSQVRDGSEEISSATTQIASTSEQSSLNSESAATAVEEITSTMHEMSSNIQNVAKNIQSQSSSVTETSTSIEQLIASIQKVADNSRKLVDIARQSAEAVASGREAVDRSTEGVRDITSVMGESAETIKQLGVRTEDIGKIIEVIDDIAEQTNLLALNAAIEAARAGEHGMG